MKISLMIRTVFSESTKSGLIGKYLQRLLIFTLMSATLIEAKTPGELSKVIDHFLNMEATSVEIKQVIDWRFSDKSDTVRVQMDIRGGRNFHVLLAGFGMEIFVTEDEMITLNHVREQILYENATPDALLKQLFVGGDLNKARYKGTKNLKNDRKRLNFTFMDDFSDWESLSMVLDATEVLEKLVLVDYDGNKYIISLKYLEEFEDFNIPKVNMDYLHYKVADLRKK